MVALASDHAGYELKEIVKEYLLSKQIPCVDFGTDSDLSCDYPLFAKKVCESILNNETENGILICGTGIGMSMTANKFKGIRAALCTNEFMADQTRRHNNANVLCLGARVISKDEALHLIDVFLSTPFEGGRHTKRIELIETVSNSKEIDE